MKLIVEVFYLIEIHPFAQALDHLNDAVGSLVKQADLFGKIHAFDLVRSQEHAFAEFLLSEEIEQQRDEPLRLRRLFRMVREQ